MTLALGGVVVVLSKYVLSCHHTPDEEPVPNWLVRVYTGPMGKVAGTQKMTCCWQRSSKKNNVVKVSETPSKTPDVERRSMADLSKADNEEIKWSSITKFLDKLFFRIFFGITILQQVVFGIIFIYGYVCGCNSSSS